ncbi:uncharacterized protein [Eucyclogobius newberryi]|uniref:uncharacterized protein n=1 Tax=Eucyclogobius newberryi TaxID=166745 RepID=UPI003B5C264C
MTAVSPALQECLCLVPTVEVQSDIQLNTSDQYFKELEVDTFELQEETVKHQPKTIYHPEPSEIIHQEIVLAVNMENTVVSERGPHVSSKIEKENITAESKVVESNHDGTVAVPVSPPVQAVDVQGEIQLNTSDQYFKEPDVETFELQEEIVKHKTKTMNYLESEIVHQEIVVAVNMENSVASEQSTHVSSTIENETITAESEDEVGSNHDGSAVVLVSPPAVETISPPEVTSALSPNMCPQYQEVSETSELTDVDHVEYTAVTEHYIKGPDESLIIHTNTQTNVLPNIISASATEEMHPPSVEMCLDANKASSKIQTFKAHNLQKNRSGGMVASEHQSSTSSEEMPFSSTVVAYESTNPLSSQAEDVQETFISNAFTEHSEEAVAEYYTTTDVPTIETSVEISVRTFTVELDTNNGQDVTTPDSEMGAVNNVDIEELSTDCADTIGMEVRLPEQYTVEEKLSVQEVMTENVDEQTMTVPEESEVAPSIVLTEEAGYSVPFFSEVHRNLSHPENMEGEEMQTESIVVDTLEDNAVISESQKIEGENFITNESAVDANDLTIGTKQVFLNSEEHVQESQGNEETIVPYRQEDVHSVEEPNTNATEFDVKKHENQIVYEPISSPESTTDGDVSTLPETHDPVGLVHTDITNTSHIIYSVSALSTDKEMLISDGYGTAEIQSVPLESPAVISPIEEYEVINGELFQKDESIRSENVLDNQTELQHLQTDGLSSVSQNEDNKMNQHQKHEEFSDNQVMSEAHTADKMQSTEESMVFEQMEQSNSAEDVTVSVTSASEDAPDGQLENTEEKCEESVTASVFSEVLEVTGPETVAGTENSTVTFTTENQEADCTCEEYVILEPVPVTTIHYDIVTQAVAESGLSEEINANTEGIISEVQQTSVVKDNVNEKITQETMVVEEMLENSTVEEVSPRPTDMMEVTPADCEPDVTQPVDVHMEPPECQILEDIEIGREIVVAQEEQEEDSDISIIEKPQESSNEEAKTIDENINETSKDDVNETRKDIGNETSKETISLDTVKKDCTTAENKEPEKPKKQEMNTQARTKARLAALAEQKAAASKRQARREQLNLLALCQEIAEDIATDSMLLKKIEEEKQAAALAAAKDEAQKKENPPAQSQEEPKGALVTPTPERTEVSSPSVTPAEDNTVSQPSTTNAESKAAAEPPKRRFFTSQVSVPLKAHEKKKLTRYQRLRQVELQREKMSWARVKKLKSDQANQMFSEMNWQASMSFSSSAADHVATAPQPVPNLIKPPSPGLSATNQPVPNAEEPKVEVSKPEAIVSEPAKALQTEPAKATTEQKPEADKTELTQKEDPKAEPSKPELRKSSRISKIESTKPASTPPPAKGKVTSKKVLPAVPPPMPNGLNNQSLKIEYKPYKPRPKYSPDDFELDDDPIPPPKACPQAKPTHQMRSNVQGRPASQTPTSSKPTVSTQHSNQLKSNVLKPVGQISGQTRPASSALAHSPAAQALLKGTQPTPSSSKILPTTKVPQKTVSTSPQSKPVVAPTESKPAASSLPQGKPASTTSQTEAAASVDQLAPSEITPAVPPDDAAAPAKCKATEDVPVVPVPTKEEFNVSNDAQKSDKNKASPVHPEDKTVAGVHPKSMTESEETDVNKASQLGQDQNVETPISDTSLQKEIKKLKEADKDGTQTIIDAGQKHFGPVACSVCGMLYSAANPEDESQHLLFHNQFISAVKYVGWKKERILSEFPDGKIILVLPDDPKYALKKIEEIREMVDNDLGFQQVESKCPSNTKTFLFISNDKKVAGCLIAEHINEGYRVIEELTLSGSEGEKVMFERQRAWCCSTTAEPAICGISRIWVVNTMRRQGIASRMLDCLRNNFIYGSNLSKDEIAFSDPTPDGKLFATCYFSTSQFLVYNFVNGTPTTQAKPENV